jgi:hypothetical protein
MVDHARPTMGSNSRLGAPSARGSRWRAAGTLLPAVAASLAGLVAVALAAETPSHGERILLPGTFFQEDVTAATAGEWQALCPTPRGLALVTTPVAIRTVPAPLPDEDPDGTGGRSVESEKCRDAFLLLRVPGLTNGPVVTTAAGRIPVPKDGVASLFVADPTESSFLQTTQKPGSDSLEILLSRGEKRQTIATIAGCCNDNWPAILWAGDLDRDGELDLLLDVSNHYAGGNLALFLSSVARKGDLVGEVARFATTGC